MSNIDLVYVDRIVYGYTDRLLGCDISIVTPDFNSIFKKIKHLGSIGNFQVFAALVKAPLGKPLEALAFSGGTIVGEQKVILTKLPSLVLHTLNDELCYKRLKRRRRKENNRKLTDKNWKQFVNRKKAISLCESEIISISHPKYCQTLR